MNEPDWQHCTERELWQYVAWHLSKAGIRSVLVGGAVVVIYTEGLYKSGDLDLVPDESCREKLTQVLGGIGFVPTRSRYFKHPLCHHLFLEFPRGPVEIGEEFPITPDEINIHGQKLLLLSPTDSVKDRLAGYIHWKSRAYFDQAVLICLRQYERIDFAAVHHWCAGEGGDSAYRELEEALNLKMSGE